MKKQNKAPSAFKRAKHAATLASVSLAVGAAIGATIGLLSAPKRGKELQSDLEREAQKLWKHLKMSKGDVERIIEQVFGEVTPETKRMYAKAKSELLTRVAKLGGKINRARYDELVDATVARVSKNKTYQKSLTKLKKEFKRMWKDLSAQL